MHQVRLEDVPKQITSLMSEAMAGEEVIFTRDQRAVLRLVQVEKEVSPGSKNWKQEMQALRGFLRGIDTHIPRDPDRLL